MILHTVNQNCALLDDCLSVTASGDAVLLLQNGVYALQMQQAKLDQAVSAGITLYALQDDLHARAITSPTDRLCSIVDYDGFVDLVVAADSVTAWT